MKIAKKKRQAECDEADRIFNAVAAIERSKVNRGYCFAMRSPGLKVEHDYIASGREAKERYKQAHDNLASGTLGTDDVTGGLVFDMSNGSHEIVLFSKLNRIMTAMYGNLIQRGATCLTLRVWTVTAKQKVIFDRRSVVYQKDANGGHSLRYLNPMGNELGRPIDWMDPSMFPAAWAIIFDTWSISFRIGNSAAVRVPTGKHGVAGLFAMRDASPGLSRRAALRHWVNHYRRKSGDGPVDVSAHLRGTGEFEWLGFGCQVHPPITVSTDESLAGLVKIPG